MREERNSSQNLASTTARIFITVALEGLASHGRQDGFVATATPSDHRTPRFNEKLRTQVGRLILTADALTT